MCGFVHFIPKHRWHRSIRIERVSSSLVEPEDPDAPGDSLKKIHLFDFGRGSLLEPDPSATCLNSPVTFQIIQCREPLFGNSDFDPECCHQLWD